MGRRQSDLVALNSSSMNTPSSPASPGGRKLGKKLDRFMQKHSSNSPKTSRHGRKSLSGSIGRGGSTHSVPQPPPRSYSGASGGGGGRRISAKSPRIKRKNSATGTPMMNSSKGTTYRHVVQQNNQTLYEWQQSNKLVTILYPSPPPEKKIFCNIAPNLLQLGAATGGLPCTWFLSHDTGGLVDTAKSQWKHDTEYCTIQLVKAHPGTVWPFVLKDDRADNVKTTIRCKNVIPPPQTNSNSNNAHVELPRRTKTVYRRAESNPSVTEKKPSRSASVGHPNIATATENKGRSSSLGRRKKRLPKGSEEKTMEMSTSSQEERERELKRMERKNSKQDLMTEAEKKGKRRSASKTGRSSREDDFAERHPRSQSATPRRTKDRSASKTRRPKQRSSSKPSRRREKAESPRVRLRKETKKTDPPAGLAGEQEQEQQRNQEPKRRSKLPSVEPPDFIYVEVNEEQQQKPLSAIHIEEFSDGISVLGNPKGVPDPPPPPTTSLWSFNDVPEEIPMVVVQEPILNSSIPSLTVDGHEEEEKVEPFPTTSDVVLIEPGRIKVETVSGSDSDSDGSVLLVETVSDDDFTLES